MKGIGVLKGYRQAAGYPAFRRSMILLWSPFILTLILVTLGFVEGKSTETSHLLQGLFFLYLIFGPFWLHLMAYIFSAIPYLRASKIKHKNSRDNQLFRIFLFQHILWIIALYLAFTLFKVREVHIAG